MPTAPSSTTTTPTPSFEFKLAAGDESITPPHGFAGPGIQVYIRDIRRRRFYLERITVEAFTDLGLRYRLSDDSTVTHLRGMPRYYCARQGVLWIWPVPEWAWTGAVEKP